MCSAGFLLSTGVRPQHLMSGTVALYRVAKRLPAAEHHFGPPAGPAAYVIDLAAQIERRDGCWLPNHVPFALEPACFTSWPRPSRSAEEECVVRLCGTASNVTFCPSAAVNEPHRARVPPAAEEARGLQVMSPCY